MSTYTKGDYVRSKSKGFVGEVKSADTRGVYVYNARSGQNDFIMTKDIEAATKQEYTSQVDERLNPKPKQSVQSTTTKPVQQPTVKTYRWLCLECGAKHNGRTCYVCGSDEKIYNTSKDVDMSLAVETRSDAPMYPTEGE